MEDLLPSLTCPKCKNWLIEQAFVTFFSSARCPYCHTRLRWARIPLLMIVFGLLSVGTGLLCIINRVSIPVLEHLSLPLSLGGGASLLLLGLICARFVELPNR